MSKHLTRSARLWAIGAALWVTCTTIAAQAQVAAPETAPPPMESVRVSDDGKGFVLVPSGKPFRPWGFNYVGDHRRIVEEYWEAEWPRVEKDFRQMRELGANVVRLHLQVGTYMKSPTEVDEAELQRLRRTLDLGQKNGLYLDLTGLNCFHLKEIPDWFDKLPEAERWQVQANFWEAIAKTCAGHPAVFCHDLMNEPIIGKPGKDEHPWLSGELGGYYFVQRISNEPGDRAVNDIAAAWVEKMVAAIRKHEPNHLITVGVIPWAQMIPGAKPIFYSPKAIEHLDFVSVHFYPASGKVDETVEALAVYDLGKPIVVEETWPLTCSLEELDEFIDKSNDRVEGWIAHYFGKTIEEHAADEWFFSRKVSEILAYWQKKGAELQ
jgi:aryl-phospho-beta-D-glucosidase BglC (GH1 family)